MKLVVWDFDGTLVDSRPLIEAGMEHTLVHLGLGHRDDLRERWLQGVGLPVEVGLRATFEPLGLDLTEVWTIYRAFDWQGHEHLLRPFPGMDALVRTLQALGVKQAIASSKRSVPLRRQLAAFGWSDLFDPLVTPDEVCEGKPHPESLERCLEAHGILPEEAIMVGDTPFDLEMAQRAGVPAVAVSHGFYAREALEAWGPMAHAPDVAALQDILLAQVTP